MRAVPLLLSSVIVFVSLDIQMDYVTSCVATAPVPTTTTAAPPMCNPLPYDKSTISPANIKQFLPYDPTDTFPLNFVMSYDVQAVLVGINDFCEFYTDGTSAGFSSLTGFVERTCALINGKAEWTIPKSNPVMVLQCITQASTCTTCQFP